MQHHSARLRLRCLRRGRRAFGRRHTGRCRTRQRCTAQAEGVGSGEAISLQNAVTAQSREKTTFDQAQTDRARKLADEGYFDAAKASRSGDAQKVFDAFNKSGSQKLLGVPTVTPVKRNLPGIGDVTTYDYEGQVADADGKPQTFKINSHDFSMAAMPYEKALELQRKGTADDNKNAMQMGLIDLKLKQVDQAGEIAANKIAAAAAKTGQGPSHEERLRYTSLFSEAGRRMGETQKALTKLSSDPLYSTAKPGSPQAQEMQDLRDSIGAYKQERDLYGGLLSGSQTAESVKAAKVGGAKPSLANAKPGAATAPVKISTKAERDALPKGTSYVAPDGTTRIKN
jgi:soluble cytochrome b562